MPGPLTMIQHGLPQPQPGTPLLLFPPKGQPHLGTGLEYSLENYIQGPDSVRALLAALLNRVRKQT